MMKRTLLIFSALVASGGTGLFAHGQSTLVIGERSATTECFQSAEMAIKYQASGIYGARQKDVDRCTEVLDENALSIRDRVATLVNRGILQAALGDSAGANESYQKALNLSANRGEVYVNIANIHMRKKHYRDAVETYSMGIELMTVKQHIGYLNRGLAHEYLREYRQAQADYAAALRLSPEWMRAKKMLARVEAKLNRVE